MRMGEQTERERLNGLLKEKMYGLMPTAGLVESGVPGMLLSRHEMSNQKVICLYKPCIGLIVQGSKRSIIGSEPYEYAEKQCLVAGVDVPGTFYYTNISSQYPYLGIALELDKYLIARLATESPAPAGQSASGPAVAVADANAALLDAFVRLLGLLEKPEQIAVLGPMIVREIHYLLLIGPQGGYLRNLNTMGTQGHQIAQAVSWLRSNFTAPLHVDNLARKVHMATSTFHRHFKEVTSLSPLQYHKRLRLYEAQRLMLVENLDAAGAGLAVGYESPSQFSREYKRLFGEPPHRDVMRMLSDS